MKVFLISLKGPSHQNKLACWIDRKQDEGKPIQTISVRAFLKKRDAKEWLDNHQGWRHFEVKSAELK
jgi:hypothetical protein